MVLFAQICGLISILLCNQMVKFKVTHGENPHVFPRVDSTTPWWLEAPLSLCWNCLEVKSTLGLQHTLYHQTNKSPMKIICIAPQTLVNFLSVSLHGLFHQIMQMSWCPTLKQQTSVSSCFLFHIRDKPSAKVSYISYLPPPPVLLFLPLPLLFSHYLPPHSHLLCLPSSAKIRFAFPSEFLVPIVMCCYHR